MAHSYDYDYFVIGGGSGGVRSSRIAAGYGAKVCIEPLTTLNNMRTSLLFAPSCLQLPQSELFRLLWLAFVEISTIGLQYVDHIPFKNRTLVFHHWRGHVQVALAEQAKGGASADGGFGGLGGTVCWGLICFFFGVHNSFLLKTNMNMFLIYIHSLTALASMFIYCSWLSEMHCVSQTLTNSEILQCSA
jgi:hypothetical protein